MDIFPLVSIIIPTYNREHLITETLNSVLAQNYVEWECLVIDDGSNDNTEVVLKAYTDKDSRFQYYKRTSSKYKGANTCRNIGLQKAVGNYVIFFDSDDVMTTNHLEVKVKAMLLHQCDYVITRTKYFNHPKDNNILDMYYKFATNDISAYNYISQKISWLTYDVCIKSSLAKSIKFNEMLQSGQEYNYFAKLVLKSTHAIFVDKVITLRRAHQNSIQGKLRKDKIKLAEGYFKVYWLTYKDICDIAEKKIKQNLMYKCYKILLKNRQLRKDNLALIHVALIKEFGFKGVYYSFCLLTKRYVIYENSYIYSKRL